MAKKKEDNELTPFQQQFLDVYFRMNFNGRLAMKQLKPHLTNESADVEASRLLSYPKSQYYIEMKRDALNKINFEENIIIDKLNKEIEIKKLQLESLKLDNEITSIEIKKQILNSINIDGNKTKYLIKEFIKLLGDDLYFILSPSRNLIKIGRSSQPFTRLTTIKTEIGWDDLEIVKIISNCGLNEKSLHKQFKHLNHRFETNGKINTEWFKYNDEIKKYIDNE